MDKSNSYNDAHWLSQSLESKAWFSYCDVITNPPLFSLQGRVGNSVVVAKKHAIPTLCEKPLFVGLFCHLSIVFSQQKQNFLGRRSDKLHS
jgi:hypothetical protein